MAVRTARVRSILSGQHVDPIDSERALGYRLDRAVGEQPGMQFRRAGLISRGSGPPGVLFPRPQRLRVVGASRRANR